MTPSDIRDYALEKLRTNPGQSRYWLAFSISNLFDLTFTKVHDALTHRDFTSKVQSQEELLNLK